ncbi:V-type ATP synthase subunit D [Thiohalobacter thiocyanaticus]|uniref:ATPase n=1 Tax=Thiohalobacter thiocyanaticus TaxID=585455 RepID=A0A426QE14_9GAMM|nr:V-type ATP synthase subunit D [Thiohalobacter thiocyanaticus]RRQ20012.1 hypothetical protein D6C00_14730 [Thiohalobacter thiocyanaticus]
MVEQATTHADLLELRDERGVMQEGFHFLDEKRLMLATECQRELNALEALEIDAVTGRERVREALRALVREQGLAGSRTLPSVLKLTTDFHFLHRNFLGTRVLSGDPGLLEEPVRQPGPEAPGRDCAEAVVEWLHRLARMAVLTHNLTELVADYRRTERRARAIEDVLLPENKQRIQELEDRLEDIDQEEAIRVRLSGSRD